MYRVAGTSIVLLGVAFGASSCMGPTYGTDKSATEQLVDDLGDSLSIAPKKKSTALAYQPRGTLVKPADPTKLIEPQQNLASTENNPAWLESPEQTRNRLKMEADENADNGSYRSPLAVSVTEGNAKSPEQQRLEFREARKIADGRENKRRFMSDPPLEYRKVDDPAKLTDLGESEAAKEKARKKEAAIAGTGTQWWQLWN
ncbi:MAG: hypothetical protein JWL86_3362 [Rhizobium sp.]|nr:hypothetical protein [Rhizobium sp.]